MKRETANTIGAALIGAAGVIVLALVFALASVGGRQPPRFYRSATPPATGSSQAARGGYPVTRVIDGDTIEVRLGKNVLEKVRFLYVNTPESVHPDTKQNVPLGKTASEYTRKRLLGRRVQLRGEHVGSSLTRGRYGRLLAYVYVDGMNFNRELIREGLSPFYTKYGEGRYAEMLRQAERAAREERKGIWGDAQLTEKYLRLKSKWGQRADKAEKAAPPVAENGSFYGEISPSTGRPKTVHVRGYHRKDGTYVRGHYRSAPRRKK